MATRTLTLEYTFDQADEISPVDGTPTGNIVLTIPVVHPDYAPAYVTAMPSGVSDFQIASTIETVWNALGKP